MSFRPPGTPRTANWPPPPSAPADHHDEASVRVDDDLVGGGVPVVLRLLRHRVVPGGHESAVHDEQGILGEPLAGLEGEHRPEVVDDPVRSRFGDPEQRRELSHRQVRAPVGRDQQGPILQRKTPRPALADGCRAPAPQHRHELAEVARAQSSERGYPGGGRRSDHSNHGVIISWCSSDGAQDALPYLLADGSVDRFAQ